MGVKNPNLQSTCMVSEHPLGRLIANGRLYVRFSPGLALGIFTHVDFDNCLCHAEVHPFRPEG